MTRPSSSARKCHGPWRASNGEYDDKHFAHPDPDFARAGAQAGRCERGCACSLMPAANNAVHEVHGRQNRRVYAFAEREVQNAPDLHSDSASLRVAGADPLSLLAQKTPSPQPAPQGEKEFWRPFSPRGAGQDEGGTCEPCNRIRYHPSRRQPLRHSDGWVKTRPKLCLASAANLAHSFAQTHFR